MKPITSSFRVVCLVLAIVPMAAMGFAQEDIDLADADLLDVKLIAGDHKLSDDVMRESDANQDGVLDQKEVEKLNLLIDPAKFDLNRNKRLTSLELTIYFANMRKHYAITVQDLYNATRMINQYDRNGDRMLSKDEAQSFPFTDDNMGALDANRDGKVSPLELAKQLAADFQELGVEALDQWNALQYVREYDKDNDLELSIEEASPAQWPRDPLTFDSDRDGSLAMKEIAIGLAARKQDNEIARSDQMNANRFLSRYDLNRDKHIDLEEIEQTGWPKDPASFDTDQDDKITVFEIALRFAKNRKERGVEQQDREAAAKLISRYDKNKNGSIDLNELVDDRADVGLMDEERFVEFDSDENQLMSRMEVATYLAKQRKKNKEEKPDKSP